ARAELTRAALPGSGHLAMAANVASDDAMEQVHELIAREWGGLDVLVNNAGIATGGPMVETTMAEWRNVLEINLLGVVRGCRLFLPGMLAAGRGHIINTASFAGLAGAPNIMSYGVAKASVVALSEQLRAETHGKGVTVSVLCPAFFRTNLLESWQGNARMKGFADKMMESSPDTLESVSNAVFAAVQRGDFLVIPTVKEPMRWRMKRWFPEFYFGQLMKFARSRGPGN
nr:SDR family NAD(P)-dependent oxidoreductase [Arenimonas sp.]